MAEKTIQERLDELKQKRDHVGDLFGAADVQTLVEGIEYAMSREVYSSGFYYGQYDTVESLETIQATQKGYAYVASTDPAVFYIYTSDGNGGEWIDSGQKFVTTSLETNLNTKSETKAPTTKAVIDGIESVNLLEAKTPTTELTKVQKYQASANINDRTAVVNQTTSDVESLGYKVLNPALSFASQVTAANTIYEIRDLFDLNNDSVTIPANCTLKFNGGTITNGTLIGANTTIEAPAVQIFKQGVFKYRGYSTYQGQEQETLSSTGMSYAIGGEHVVIGGTWNNVAPKAEWLGLNTISENVDASPVITNYINLHNAGQVIKLPKREYGIFDRISITGKTFDAQGAVFTILAVATVYDETIPIPENTYPLTAPIYPQGIAPLQGGVIHVGNGKLYNLTIDGANITYGEEGSTTDTYVHKKNGRYGLIGSLGYKSEVIGCTIQNAYQCGILDATYSDVTIKDTTITNCIEHCVYVRPVYGGTMNIIGCKFDTWYKQETHRTGAKALKIIQNDDIETNVSSSYTTENKLTLNITDCEFSHNSTSNPIFQLNIGAAYTNIVSCRLADYNNIFKYTENTCNVEGYATKVNIVTFRDCTKGSRVQTNTTNWGAIVSFYNCKELETDIFQYAYVIDGCDIISRYLTEVDYRSHISANNVSENRKMFVRNSSIKAQGSFQAGQTIYADGSYEIVFENVALVEEFTSDTPLLIVFKPNNTNTAVLTQLKVTLLNCDFAYKNLNASISGIYYDFEVIGCIFSAKFKTGYPARYCVFKEAKSLLLDNVKSKPYEGTGDVVNIYRETTTNLISYKNANTEQNGYTSPTYGTYYPAKGEDVYDNDTNMPAYWRGDKYQHGRVFIKETSSSIGKLSQTEVGVDCYLTDTHRWVTWSGAAWFDALGNSPFIQITQGNPISGIGSSDTGLNITIDALDDNNSDTTLTFASSETWCYNIELYGTNNNKIRADVTANESATSRTTIITITQGSGTSISTKQVVVTQLPKEVKINLSATTIEASGGNITFNRPAGAVNVSTITTDVDWITLPTTIDNTTSGSNTITVAANTGSARTATLTVTGTNTLTKTYTITQEGVS